MASQSSLSRQLCGKVGMRISSTGEFNDVSDENPIETFFLWLRDTTATGSGTSVSLKRRRTAKGAAQRIPHVCSLENTLERFLRVNGGYDGRWGEEALRSGHADAVAYGRAFLANPDLPRRLQIGAALNEPAQSLSREQALPDTSTASPLS